MQRIDAIKDLKKLRIPESVTLLLREELMMPFDSDESTTEAFWQEQGCALILIEESDCVAALMKEEPLAQQLKWIGDYPEVVVGLGRGNERYLLALTIKDDEGGGYYLLAPITHSSSFINQLKQQITE